MIPVKKNETISLNITDVTSKGFGVGDKEGYKIFVQGALPGELITAKILRINKTYGYGTLVDIQEKSENRTESPCDAFGKCGGCQFLHVNYHEVLKYKKKFVTDALSRIGGIPNPNVADVVNADNIFHYRNKAVFPIVNSYGTISIGMYAARSHRIIPLTKCLLQHEIHILVLQIFLNYISENNLTAYDETKHNGLLRHILIRTNGLNEAMVIIVINGNRLPNEQDLCKKMQEIGIQTLVVNKNRIKGNTILGDPVRVLYGNGFITEKLGGTSYRISPKSFFQVNSSQAKKLYDIALRQADIKKGEKVLDAHCGAGGILLYTAAVHPETDFIGADILPEAIVDANENAVLNGITNTKFLCGPSEELINQMLTIKPDVVFLDPPRKGNEPKLLQALIEAKIKRIIYISCDEATFARDVKILTQNGYILKEVTPVDMFPGTGKIEISACLVIE